jgi:hypothetical protein
MLCPPIPSLQDQWSPKPQSLARHDKKSLSLFYDGIDLLNLLVVLFDLLVTSVD